MNFLVDGHNLIPKLGMRLDSLDDEQALVARLQEFCRLQRAMVEVYFDGAPGGNPAQKKTGAVTAHFIRRGSSADAAIETRLSRLGKQARNWTVVSSDFRVQAAGRAVHANVSSSEEFAAKIFSNNAPGGQPKSERDLNPAEVEEWLDLFKRGKK